MGQEAFDDNRLSQEDAEKEADMMRAEIGVDPVDGTLRGTEWRKSPTAEDYEQAANLIAELQKLAKEEPATEKVLHTLARAGQSSAKALTLAIVAVGGMFDPVPFNAVRMDFEKTKTAFWDDARRLREAEKGGEKYRVKADAGDPLA